MTLYLLSPNLDESLKKLSEAYGKAEKLGLKCFIFSHNFKHAIKIEENGGYFVSPWTFDMINFLKEKGSDFKIEWTKDMRFGNCIYFHITMKGYICYEKRLMHEGTAFFNDN